MHITGPGNHRHIDGQPLTRPDARLVGTAAAGIQRLGILVQTDVQHVGAILEDLLRAVAVMHIEVHDGDALQPVSTNQLLCGNRHIVEQTKPARLIAFGVVARRTHCTKCVVHLTVHHRLARRQHAPRRQQRHVVAALTDPRIHRPDERKLLLTDPSHQFDVGRFVHTRHHVRLSRLERQRRQLRHQP